MLRASLPRPNDLAWNIVSRRRSLLVVLKTSPLRPNDLACDKTLRFSLSHGPRSSEMTDSPASDSSPAAAVASLAAAAAISGAGVSIMQAAPEIT